MLLIIKRSFFMRNYFLPPLVILVVLLLPLSGFAEGTKTDAKTRVYIVSSYHPEYRWSQETNKGVCQAFFELGYLDSAEQVEVFTRTYQVESERAVFKKAWMDTKRKKTRDEKAVMSRDIAKDIIAFEPDILLLGDDNATNYLGNEFLDSDFPIVFWGVNNTPLKYGLIDSLEIPGHNVTGVYQLGNYAESLDLLKKIVPSVKTFAILADDSSTGRSHYKAIEHLHRQGELSLQWVTTVSTQDFEDWKQRALALQEEVDAFYIAQYGALKDQTGNHVSPEAVAEWYLNNIRVPEAVGQHQFIVQGMLCGVDDSAFNQGYAAVKMAHVILSEGKQPAVMPPSAPSRGALMLNRLRAEQLQIQVPPDSGIELFVDDSVLKEKTVG